MGALPQPGEFAEAKHGQFRDQRNGKGRQEVRGGVFLGGGSTGSRQSRRWVMSRSQEQDLALVPDSKPISRQPGTVLACSDLQLRWCSSEYCSPIGTAMALVRVRAKIFPCSLG